MTYPEKILFENGVSLNTFSFKNKDVAITLIIPSGHADCVPDAHFLEHMVFKSNKQKTAEELTYQLEGRGIRYNGWTHTDRIQLFLLSPKDHVETALQILFECFINDDFQSEEVELEKNILLSELSTECSNPYVSFEKKMRNIIFSGHPLNFQQETEENIRSLTVNSLKDSKRSLFFYWNFCLGVTGDIDYKEIVHLISDTFGSIKKIKQKKPPFPSQHHSGAVEIEERGDINSGSVIVAFPVVGIDHEDSSVLEFISHLLGGSTGGYSFSNRLFQEIRAKRGLAYETHTLYERYPGVGLFVVSSSGIVKKNVHTVKTILLDEIQKFTAYDVGRDELERCKRNFIANKYRDHYWDILRINSSLCLSDTYNIPWGFEDFQQKISSLTSQKIRDAANTYFNGQYFIGEILPK